MASRGYVRPVGPLPAGVYWRRRGLLALALLAVLFVGRAVLGGGDGKATPASAATSPRPTPTATHAAVAHQRAHRHQPVASDSPVPTGTPAAPPGKAAARTGAQPPAAAAGTPPACRVSQVTLTASADATSYPSDQDPRFTLAVANTGHRACRVDLGTAVRSLVVYSGSDRIWSSGDCVEGGHTVVTLRPQHRIAYASTWTRHRSSATTCGSAPVAALPGTYRVSGHLGGVTSSDVAFVLR
jgi:hypothetical protein